MNISTRRALADVIRTSLNSDQTNYIGGHVDPKFDLRHETGFGKHLAIPAEVAADTVVNYFRNEEDLVRFFEVMINRQGTFVFGSTITIKGKSDFIKLLAKKRWIYDPDLELFFRDPFFAESINFLKSVELIDLRSGRDTESIIAEMATHAEALNAAELDWLITIRAYGLGESFDRLIRALLEILLLRQNAGTHAYALYCCLRELAVNAAKANYKHLFRGMGPTEEGDYSENLQAFRQELEDHGDENLERAARNKDVFFDLDFKSSHSSISMWAVNYVPLMKVEKTRILSKLRLKEFHKDSFADGPDELREGAGLGLNLVKTILKGYYPGGDPVKVVFYPESTKIGFVIRREDLLRGPLQGEEKAQE